MASTSIFTIDRAVLDGITDPEAREVAEDLIRRGTLRLVEGDPRDPRPIPSRRPDTFTLPDEDLITRTREEGVLGERRGVPRASWHGKARRGIKGKVIFDTPDLIHFTHVKE